MADTSLVFNVLAKTDQAEAGFGKLSNKMKVVGVAAAAMALKFGKDSVASFVAAEQSQSALQAALSKFPATADTNINRLNALNASLAKKTKFDDDATASGQAVLAQFKLTGSQIEQLTPLMQDYAAKTGRDLPTAAQDLGKAMLGQGRALKAIGLNFTDTGSAAGNFSELMGGLRGQVGGFATKEGQTAAGQAAILSNQFGEIEETVGSKLVPVLTRLAGKLVEVIGFVQNNSTAVGGLVSVLGGGIAALLVITKGIAAFNAISLAMGSSMSVALGPIGLVIIAIAALAAGVIFAYKHSETFRNIVNTAFSAVASAGRAMWDALRAAFNFITDAFLTVASTIIHGAATMFGWVPGVGGKLRDAADKFDVFRATVNAALNGVRDNVTVHTAVAGVPAAIAEIADLQYRINQVPRSVTTMFHAKAERIPRYASGTSFHPGGMALVGENGPELVNLPAGAAVSTAGETRQMVGAPNPVGWGGGTVVNNISINMPPGSDGSDVVAKIQEYERRNGKRWRDG